MTALIFLKSWHDFCNRDTMQAINANSLVEMLDQFPTEQHCAEFIAKIRWPNGPRCPKCGHHSISWRKDTRLNCVKCHHNFSVRVGTMFEGSNPPLRKWFAAIWLFANSKKGISSMQLHRDLGVTQTTAWKILKKIRENAKSVQEFTDAPLSGVERQTAYRAVSGVPTQFG